MNTTTSTVEPPRTVEQRIDALRQEGFLSTADNKDEDGGTRHLGDLMEIGNDRKQWAANTLPQTASTNDSEGAARNVASVAKSPVVHAAPPAQSLTHSSAQPTIMDQFKAEHDPSKRSELAKQLISSKRDGKGDSSVSVSTLISQFKAESDSTKRSELFRKIQAAKER